MHKIINVVDNTEGKVVLLRSLGIELKNSFDPSNMVSDNDYYAFFERVAASDRDATTLPLRVGASMHCDEYGAFGLAWKTAPDLRGSYDRAERYARMLTSVSTYKFEATDDGGYMHLQREGERRLGMRLSNEATIASIASISRQVSTKVFIPIAVYFKHRAPESIAAHEAYFECPVHFESDRDALHISIETLRTPNHLGDKSISSFIDMHLEAELSKINYDSSLDRLVKDQVVQSLSEGVPAISDVAKSLGMSERTLQRRLSKQGYSYQSLADESRRQFADRLLKQTDYSLAEIAFLTGFSEQSAFTRAFKRWEGQTPRSFRINL